MILIIMHVRKKAVKTIQISVTHRDGFHTSLRVVGKLCL